MPPPHRPQTAELPLQNKGDRVMARNYGKLFVSIWDADGEFRQRTADAQRLYMLFVSHPKLSAAGTLPLQPRQWARFAADTTEKQIARALAELVDHRYVLVDEATEELLVRTFVVHDGGTRTPNIVKAIERAIDHIESKPLRQAATEGMAKALAEGFPKPLAEGLAEGLEEGLPQGLRE
jgi:hypothetical protein